MEIEKPIKEGMLRKYTNIVKGYKKRYFELYSDMLVYYKTKNKENSARKIHLK